ncbi:DUF5343 domain-containing protein [Microbacterium terricola]|uniref:DUF5343 domain-containing protein n=1 Tax=Microbacterium terricola TaxID=344163 RepID=A0ABM8E1A6_9MICO|nr:DUF5343 domain-containing protein [Microbacterium terricola]UYK40698.1 DUF5343 domain-containing protein [Microbacterium terricola]BDV31566.1 hypothetical protein Microterr_22260 [Microbacterium terricola]
MAAEIPYMPSVVNVAAILDKIRSAGTPPKFTHDFLKSTLGFGSSNDRAMVKVLRSLGFISADGTPTQRYNEFKGDPGKALATGLREGWPDLFMADQKVYEKSVSQVQGIVKTVTGAGDAVAQKTASTFKALSDKADWSAGAADKKTQVDDQPTEVNSPDETRNAEGGSGGTGSSGVGSGLFQLHHDIHIHLPPTTEVSVYRAIFQAIKAELM